MTSVPPILIVDDDDELRELIAIHLAAAGYPTVEASDGPSALDTVHRTEALSLMLLDLRMPAMNGLEVLAAMRCDGSLERVPVVVLSGDPDAGREALRAGARDSLKKPLDAKDLVEGVRRNALPK